MKNKDYQPVTIVAYGNSVLDLPDEIPGLFVLSEYNDQYQENQKKKYKNKINKKRKKA